MLFEQSIDISATQQAVFDAYKDVASWAEWDPETESAVIDGEFAVGTTGKIKPKGAPLSNIKITEVTENQSFSVEAGLPLCKMNFIHIMQPQEGGTKLINKIEFSGLLAPVFGRLVGKAISKSLPGSLAGIMQYIESRR